MTYKHLVVIVATIWGIWGLTYISMGKIPEDAPPTAENVLAILSIFVNIFLVFGLVLHLIENWDEKIF